MTDSEKSLPRLEIPASQKQYSYFRAYRAAFSSTRNPIFLFFGSGGAMSRRMASKTILNCASYFFSSSANFRAN